MAAGGEGDRRRLFRARFAAASRGANEEFLDSYANSEEDTFTETRKFMGRAFLIRESRPTFEWRLVGEQSEFLGYMVQKATAVQDSTNIEAWFTPQIPVSAGPGPYSGLPGLILVVSVNRGEELYSAVEVDVGTLEEGAILAPEDGDEVTREEYETLVEEKLEEIEPRGGEFDEHRNEDARFAPPCGGSFGPGRPSSR